MEHLLDNQIFNSLLARIDKLTHETQGQWGKMNVAQMLAHVNASIAAPAGVEKGRQLLMGKIMSLFAKPMFLGEKPYKHDLPTAPHFLISTEKDFDKEKEKLVTLLKKISEEKNELGNRVHTFLGKISPEEWSRAIYKHIDHHLQQFGV